MQQGEISGLLGEYVMYCSGIVSEAPPGTPVAFSALPVAPGDGPVQPVRVALMDPDDFVPLRPLTGPSTGSNQNTVRVLTFNYLLTFERAG